MLTTARTFALVTLTALAAGACGGRALPEPAEQSEPPFTKVERRRNPETGTRWKQWDVLVYPDGRKVKHGTEFVWHPNDQLQQERHFEYGELMGRMRSWYADGTLRSEYRWGPEGTATPMRFWHANGKLSAEGDAIRGERVGTWRYYHESGALESEGRYENSLREGLWCEFYEDGSVAAEGLYERGKKVGLWDRWLPGQNAPIIPE